MKERPYICPPPCQYNRVSEPQKQRIGQKVVWLDTDPSEQPLDLDPTLHTVEIDAVNGTLQPVETMILPPSRAIINTLTDDIINQQIDIENENENHVIPEEQ